MAEYKVVTGQCRISSVFGNRTDPFDSKKTEFHTGVDFAPIPSGTNCQILSLEDGTVLLLRYSSPILGNYVEIIHENGYVSRYQHLKSISSALKVNQPIKAGTYLGMMGTTGSSTGVHLHLGLRTGREQVGNTYIDPLPYVLGSASLKNKTGSVSVPSLAPAVVPVPVSNNLIKIGSNVKIKITAKTYKGNILKIPDWVKGRNYKVIQLNKEYALLSDIMSWVNKGDLEVL